ncbi:MAG TPA: aspartate kinase [Microscillaceae bacterium]|jgi:aspartate kinase|nr:aspartate kinase [Microscillaceae bacterium]
MATVFKFGGASTQNAEGIKRVEAIIESFVQENPAKGLVVVVSAMGKTTNALEKILQQSWDNQAFQESLEALQQYHRQIVSDLLAPQHQAPVTEALADYFQQMRHYLENKPEKVSFDAYYDGLVAYGELLSSTIVAYFLEASGLPTQWVDARRCCVTDSTWREGKIDWIATQNQVKQHIAPHLGTSIVVTQGFIGANYQHKTTTLGREGSDFTAGVLAYCLEATQVVIWKDVKGVWSADPKRFSWAQPLPQLSYRQTAEMSYLGASVVHPKTLAPLAQKQIPLFVKSFAEPQAVGTCIAQTEGTALIPMALVKENQVYVSLYTRHLQPMDEQLVEEILKRVALYNLKINLIQKNSFQIELVLEHHPHRLQPWLNRLEELSLSLEKKVLCSLVSFKNCPWSLLAIDVPEGQWLLHQQNNGWQQAVVVSSE